MAASLNADHYGRTRACSSVTDRASYRYASASHYISLGLPHNAPRLVAGRSRHLAARRPRSAHYISLRRQRFTHHIGRVVRTTNGTSHGIAQTALSVALACASSLR